MATTAITRVTRKGHPNHPIELKLRLAAAACAPGVSVANLALVNGLNANLLFKWRRQYRAGQFGVPGLEDAIAPKRAPTPSVKLLPVVASVPAEKRPRVNDSSQRCIEIVLADATVRVCGEVSAKALRTVLDCLAQRL